MSLREFERETTTHLPAEHARQVCANLLKDRGQLLDGEASATLSEPATCGIVGSGLANLNPVFVAVQCKPTSDHSGGNSGTHIHLYCAAKEGLIKQHAAEKVGEALFAEIKQLLNGLL